MRSKKGRGHHLTNRKKFSPEELAQFNGADGKPVYIAYQGRVYDVSDSGLWQGGEHMAGHLAGADLTGELPSAPHGEEVFQRYPQVGELLTNLEVSETAAAEVPGAPPAGLLARLLRRFPLLRRHPHPMVVHFPIVFMISTPVFALLYVFTGIRSFETTAFHCLGGGVLFIPVALATGLATWGLNYQWRPLRPVIIKLILTPIMLAVAASAFVWRLFFPNILSGSGGMSGLGHSGKLYLGLLCALAPLVSLIGWYGATLSFPTRREELGPRISCKSDF
jgi:predicted heme/steroid binding protein/uncharacterized membrane protein